MFPPTYKFVLNTCEYVKGVIPGWTDRIIYKCKEKDTIEIMNYDCIRDINISDHLPVIS